MKHSLLFWSRKAHCWVGVYLSAVTLLWLAEVLFLPMLYEPELEGVPAVVPAAAPVATAQTDRQDGADKHSERSVLSVQEVLERFSREQAGGQALTPDSAVFLPQEGVWVVRDAERYVSVTYDAYSGEVRSRTFDAGKLLEEQNGLTWLSPALGASIKVSFQPLFVLLCVTGIHLLLGRKRRSGQNKAQASTLNAVPAGETCLYERTDDPCLAGRLAALGFLPGVGVRMVRNAGRGPLLVLARHTRVALGRDVAAGIVVVRRG